MGEQLGDRDRGWGRRKGQLQSVLARLGLPPGVESEMGIRLRNKKRGAWELGSPELLALLCLLLSGCNLEQVTSLSAS